MKRYESGVKMIAASQSAVYSMLSDLNNVARLQDNLPADKIENLRFDADNVSCSVSPVGTISLSIIDREPEKCIKLTTTQSPMAMTLWIQIVSTGDNSCKIKLTLEADVNPFIAKMVEKPLKDGLEKIADALTIIPYNS